MWFISPGLNARTTVQSWCSCAHCCHFLQWIFRHRHPDWSAALQPHRQQTPVHGVFWHLFIKTSITFLHFQSEQFIDWIGPAFAPHMHKKALCHHCSFFGPPFKKLLTGNTRAAGLEAQSCSWWPRLIGHTDLTITMWPSSNPLKFFCLPIFPVSNVSLRAKCSLLPNISCPLTLPMMKRWSVVFTSPVSGHNVIPDCCKTSQYNKKLQ